MILHGDCFELIKEQEDNQKDTWSGKVQPAYNKLRKLAGDIATSDTTFPRSSNKLRGALKSIEVNLRTFGITYEIGDHKHDGTDITFKKASEKSSDNKNNNHGCIPFVLIESSLDFEYIQELYFSPEYTAEDKLMPFHNTRL